MKRLIRVLGAMLALSSCGIAQPCYKSSVVSPSPFMGNDGEIFKLVDGSLWEVKYEYKYLYEYHPSVVICPSQGKLMVGEQSLRVVVVSGVGKNVIAPKGRSSQPSAWQLFEETQLSGGISGTVQQGRLFETTSGNVYEVTSVTLQLVLELQPKVTILTNGSEYKLIVEGFAESLICKLLSSTRLPEASVGGNGPQIGAPTIHGADCRIPQADNPNITLSINPNVTYRYNPGVTYAINPDVTYSINPNATYRYNPSVTYSINPDVTRSLDPNNNKWSGFFACSPDGNLIGESVIANDEVMILYTGNKWSGYFVSNKQAGFNFFDRDNAWSGFIVPTTTGGYAFFNLDKEWVFSLKP